MSRPGDEEARRIAANEAKNAAFLAGFEDLLRAEPMRAAEIIRVQAERLIGNFRQGRAAAQTGTLTKDEADAIQQQVMELLARHHQGDAAAPAELALLRFRTIFGREATG